MNYRNLFYTYTKIHFCHFCLAILLSYLASTGGALPYRTFLDSSRADTLREPRRKCNRYFSQLQLLSRCDRLSVMIPKEIENDHGYETISDLVTEPEYRADSKKVASSHAAIMALRKCQLKADLEALARMQANKPEKPPKRVSVES